MIISKFESWSQNIRIFSFEIAVFGSLNHFLEMEDQPFVEMFHQSHLMGNLCLFQSTLIHFTFGNISEFLLRGKYKFLPFRESVEASCHSSNIYFVCSPVFPATLFALQHLERWIIMLFFI